MISPNIIDSFCVEDVTEHEQKLQAAFRLVANSYAKLSSSKVNTSDVYEELCQDKYHRCGLARTITLTGIIPGATNNKTELLGTLRIVLGSSVPGNHLLPLEAMHLVTPKGGWENFDFGNFDPHKAIEYGRLAFNADCKKGLAKELKFHLHVLREITVGAYQLAIRQFAKTQAWGMATQLVAKSVIESGINMIHAPDIELNYQQNKTLFEKYDRYWIKGSPGFYKIEPV